jgi:DNA-binding transcriptional ArsR family regulator
MLASGTMEPASPHDRQDGLGPGATDPESWLRKVSDARALRALAHPTRIALLEAVALRGPLTATEAAAIIGGTVANAAYHLRTLAKYDYIVEAPGGVGRERPWTVASTGMSFDDNDPDPTVALAAQALSDVMFEHWLNRFRRYRGSRARYPEAVRAVSTMSQFVLFGTTQEIEQTQEELMAVFMKYRDRITDHDARPSGAVPFEVLMGFYPFDPPAPDSDADTTGSDNSGSDTTGSDTTDSDITGSEG